MIEFFQFVVYNKINLSQTNSYIKNVFKTIKGYFKVLFLYVLIVVILTSLGINTSKKSVFNTPNVPEIYKLLMVVIIMPIIEEIVFRLSLLPNKKKLYFSLIFGNILCFFFFRKSFVNEIFHKTFFLTTTFLSLYCLNRFYDKIVAFIFNNIRLLIHLMVFLFCIMHIPNYIFGKGNTPYLLLLLQILNGYYFSFVRLEYGFYYAIFIHIFHNFLVSLPLLIKYI